MSEEKQAQPGILQKVQVWLPMLLAITLVAGMLIGLRLQMAGDDLIETSGQVTTVAEGQGKIEELIRYIEAKYVDEVNREELIQKAIEQVLTLSLIHI
jgi:carboxyl-terminal processing protease